MLPPRTDPRWQRLVSGEVEHHFGILSAAMCISRIVRFVQKEGRSPQAIELGIEDAHAFFTKFEASLAEDIRAIFGPGEPHAPHDC